LDSYKKSYGLVDPQWRHISVEVNRAHGHYWHFPEVDGFVDSILREGRSFVRITPPVVKEGTLSSKLNRVVSPKETLLCFTKDQGPWDKRTWETRPAQVTAQTLHAILPEDRPLVAFLALKDEEGWHVSSEHIELE
jgi:hypothetical protein